jgi:Xaa-Pro aminopeptidase
VTVAFSQRLPGAFYRRVQDGVRDGLVAAELDALVSDDPEDVAYLTGFFHHPCERPVAVWLDRDGACTLLLPRLEHDHALAQRAAAALVSYPEYPGVRPPFEALAGAVSAGRGRLGVPSSITLARLAALRAAFPAAEVVETGLVADARLRKHPEEVALHQEAGRITDLMLAAGRSLVEEAVAAGTELPSEAELAAHVGSVGVGAMHAGHEDVVVVPMLAGGLVYAGANSALPHALPSGYRPRPGDSFVLSLGCAVGGRFVEGERTLFLGDPTATQRRHYEVVREAQQTGADALRPGARCADVNRACLQVIRSAGLGDHLRHRQGHGIGLGMHEPPWLEDGDLTALEPGMVVSDEPGIYVLGEAGFRISDSLLITDDGARPFTSYPRRLDDVVIPM